MALVTNPFMFRGEPQIPTSVATILMGTTATALTLTPAESSGIVQIAQGTSSQVITLPAPALGLNYKFIVTTSNTNLTQVISGTTSEIMGGQFITISSNPTVALIRCVVGTDRSFEFNANMLVGDTASVWSDGTNWYVQGNAIGATAQSTSSFTVGT